MLRAPSAKSTEATNLSDILEAKYGRLRSILGNLESVLIAFSGGVDSTLLLKTALDTLGKEHVLAVTADSETYPSRELEEAKSIAAALGARHRIVETSELSVPGYARNDRNRCYFCRHNLFDYLRPIQREENIAHIVYGLITDDAGDFRPGIRAAIERGVRGPLQEAGLSKEDVRTLSKQLNLHTWDKPSLACLSSRVAFGEQITEEKLKMIDSAEEFIRSLGVSQARVRTHGRVARIEVEPKDIAKIVDARETVVGKLKELGYKHVALDLSGYRSGSMNEDLTQ